MIMAMTAASITMNIEALPASPSPVVEITSASFAERIGRSPTPVVLAVATLFAAGHYAEAGIVSFFMLLGQIIETRTDDAVPGKSCPTDSPTGYAPAIHPQPV